MDALLALEDGTCFPCRSFTGPCETSGEIVFNTSMTGYQEILTDPSYYGQMVTMTYPLIGNYGINEEDMESDRIHVLAFLMKEYQKNYSNYRAKTSLYEFLYQSSIPGIEDLDTRALTRHIRTAGAMRAVISTHDLNKDSLIQKARSIQPMSGLDLVKYVTTDVPYLWKQGKKQALKNSLENHVWRREPDTYSVVAFDYGIKYSILNCLEQSHCEVLVLPARTSSDIVKHLAPDGIFLSNGPGDPEAVDYAIKTVSELLGFRPMFGICLGHQILGLALGAKTYKLKFGHRGANQPAKHLLDNHIEITSQNHGFAVDKQSLSDKGLELTHINLNDGSVEGFRHQSYHISAVQYHPEASPGPHDAIYFFDRFISMMKGQTV